MTSHEGVIGSSAASNAKNCAGLTTHGSSAASFGSTSGAIGCVTSGPFANWMAPDFGSTTQKCLTRGVNWDISAQGHLTGPISLQVTSVQPPCNRRVAAVEPTCNHHGAVM